MKLAKIADETIGLVVTLPNGPHIVDIAKSVSVFAPHDPLSNGLLNGAFKDGGDWPSIVKHWAHLQRPLKRLLSSRKPARTTRAWPFTLLSIGI
jgi:hypothetical protein